MTTLAKIEGIGDVFASKLKTAKVTKLEDLLERAATPKGRKELATATGISETLILKWANRADLFRIKGIGEEYSDLLECAGVDTVAELAQRNAENLFKKINESNVEKNLVNKLPALSQVQNWVEQAKALPRKLTY